MFSDQREQYMIVLSSCRQYATVLVCVYLSVAFMELVTFPAYQVKKHLSNYYSHLSCLT